MIKSSHIQLISNLVINDMWINLIHPSITASICINISDLADEISIHNYQQFKLHFLASSIRAAKNSAYYLDFAF